MNIFIYGSGLSYEKSATFLFSVTTNTTQEERGIKSLDKLQQECFIKIFVRSEEISKSSLIYLMYRQSTGCEKPICLHLDNFIAFQTVIQELRTACDDRKREYARR